MTKSQVDPATGETLPPFGVSGGSSDMFLEPYKKIKGVGVQDDVMYLIKANAGLNTEAYSYLQMQLSSSKVRFLIDEQTAKVKLLGTKKGQAMTLDERSDYLRPYVLTSVLREQMLNLIEDRGDGVSFANIILKKSNNSIKSDKVSALIYGLYYIKQIESKKNRKRLSIKDLMLFN